MNDFVQIVRWTSAFILITVAQRHVNLNKVQIYLTLFLACRSDCHRICSGFPEKAIFSNTFKPSIYRSIKLLQSLEVALR
jgi:hypothetical protein